MAFHRPFLLAALLPMSFVACGGTDEIVPEGTHYHYVGNKALVPTTNNESREYGLDLNKDGTVDNQLGMVLVQLKNMNFDVQGTLDKSVAEGDIILLFDFQTKDFMNAAAAGLKILLGDNPMPAACNSGETYTCNTATPPVCTGCGHHLGGTGTFAVSASSPDNAAVSGKIAGGTFTGGPGDITLQIALGGTMAIDLNLIGARAKLTGISDAGIQSAILAGALTQDDLNTKVIPAIQQQLIPTIMRDCNMLSSPPGCGCTDGSTGKTILSLFDTMPKDCMVTVMEIQENNIIKSLLAPDVVINGKMALSLGIKVTATKGEFTAP